MTVQKKINYRLLENLMQKAGSYSVGDLKIELTDFDILRYFNKFVSQYNTDPTIEDLIPYKIDELENKEDPLSWMFKNLSNREAWEAVNNLSNIKESYLHQAAVLEKTKTHFYQSEGNYSGIHLDFLHFGFDADDSVFPIKLKNLDFNGRIHYRDFNDSNFKINNVAEIGYLEKGKKWVARFLITGEEKKFKTVENLFRFIYDNLQNHVYDHGSRRISRLTQVTPSWVRRRNDSSFPFYGKITDSEYFKQYYRTSEAFELNLFKDNDEKKYAFGCVYKNKIWIAKNFDSKEKMEFDNCLAACEWLCIEAYRQYEIKVLIWHDFRLFELSLIEMKSTEI